MLCGRLRDGQGGPYKEVVFITVTDPIKIDVLHMLSMIASNTPDRFADTEFITTSVEVSRIRNETTWRQSIMRQFIGAALLAGLRIYAVGLYFCVCCYRRLVFTTVQTAAVPIGLAS